MLCLRFWGMQLHWVLMDRMCIMHAVVPQIIQIISIWWKCAEAKTHQFVRIQLVILVGTEFTSHNKLIHSCRITCCIKFFLPSFLPSIFRLDFIHTYSFFRIISVIFKFTFYYYFYLFLSFILRLVIMYTFNLFIYIYMQLFSNSLFNCILFFSFTIIFLFIFTILHTTCKFGYEPAT